MGAEATVIIIINRSAHVEVRQGMETIFRKNKPPDHGGMTSRLLAAFGIGGTGVYAVDLSDVAVQWIMAMNRLDARKPEDRVAADDYANKLQWEQKVVTRVS